MTRALILCLALFAVSAQGQDDTLNVSHEFTIRPIAANTFDLSARPMIHAEAFANTLLSLYAQYEQDCLRDTVIDFGYYEVSDDGEQWTRIYVSERKKWAALGYPFARPYYRPRITPNGLDSNFVNWLRKRK